MGEEVIVGVEMGDDLIAIVELVLAMVTVHVIHWRLQGVSITVCMYVRGIRRREGGREGGRK